MSIVYELEKKSSLVTRAFSAKSCTRDTDSLHSCTRLRLVQEMACLYHECKILPRKHSYPNLIPICVHRPATLSYSILFLKRYLLHAICWCKAGSRIYNRNSSGSVSSTKYTNVLQFFFPLTIRAVYFMLATQSGSS